MYSIRGIVEQDLGHLSITSGSSLFLNKTDLKQLLFNVIAYNKAADSYDNVCNKLIYRVF